MTARRKSKTGSAATPAGSESKAPAQEREPTQTEPLTALQHLTKAVEGLIQGPQNADSWNAVHHIRKAQEMWPSQVMIVSDPRAPFHDWNSLR